MKQNKAAREMITSAANPAIRRIRLLARKAKQRREEGVFLVEGPRMAGEIPEERLEGAWCSESFAADERYAALRERLAPQVVSDALFKELSETTTPQGILALVRMTDWKREDLIREGRPVLLLETLQDPGNLGTIFRTGEGAGIGGILMDSTTVDPGNPKVVRSTMGSMLRVPYVISQDLGADIAWLKAQGYTVFAAHLEGQLSYTEADLKKPAAFLIGNEGNGLTPETAALADEKILIPMEGRVESLNAAIAATLLVYEAFRQRRDT